jgi:hypothetical protein
MEQQAWPKSKVKFAPPNSVIKARQSDDLPPNSDDTIMEDPEMTMDGDGIMGGPTVLLDELFTKLPRSS